MSFSGLDPLVVGNAMWGHPMQLVKNAGDFLTFVTQKNTLGIALQAVQMPDAFFSKTKGWTKKPSAL